ncbi:hypothetical protein HHK36_031626 [Tetracentron sinense]|uniref:Uncharacterized protein n=1 Tax=Tetracentron sinense TaxID=13715 RepID=A0A834Y9C0_TETSI|nr:hypothetical protein HHK36_031626 [Tetracentron sinense]
MTVKAEKREAKNMMLIDSLDVAQQLNETMDANMVDGNGTEVGHIIVTTIGVRNGETKQTICYMGECVVGHGSFGIVFQMVYVVVLKDKRLRIAWQYKKYFVTYSSSLISESVSSLLPFLGEPDSPASCELRPRGGNFASVHPFRLTQL